MESSPAQNINVEAAIMGILSQVMAMGANDAERSVLMSILEDYRKKVITGEEAISKAEGVRDSKNAYH